MSKASQVMGSIASIKTLVSAKSIDSVRMARNESIDNVNIEQGSGAADHVT